MGVISTEDDGFDYYYVGMGGAVIIPQNRPVGGGPNPNGFNIAEATKFLFNMFGKPVVITNWKKTTNKRRREFEAFVAEIYGGPIPESDKPQRPKHLSLVRDPETT